MKTMKLRRNSSIKSQSAAEEELRYAALHNDVESVRKLCKLHNVNRETEDQSGTTPLNLACYYGNYEMCHELITNQGVLINHGDRNGHQPIHKCCEQQHIEIVRLLLDNGVDVNALTNKGQTPLHLAVDGGNFELIRLLLLNGADKTIKDNYDQSPVDLAKKKRISDIICLLSTDSDEEIRQLISNQTTPYHRRNSVSSITRKSSSHTHNKHASNKHNLELERERIMRGEITGLKDKVNQIQYEYSKLLDKLSSFEDSMQTLSHSLSSINSIVNGTPSLSSPPIALSPQLQIASLNGRFPPHPKKSPSPHTNQSISPLSKHDTQRKSTKNLDIASHSPVDSNNINTLRIVTPSTEEMTPSPRTAHVDHHETNTIHHLDVKSPGDATLDLGSVGSVTSIEYNSFHIQESKSYTPTDPALSSVLDKPPSLRHEANSLELGADSDYQYSQATKSPNLPDLAEHHHGDHMTPIREESHTADTERTYSTKGANTPIHNVQFSKVHPHHHHHHKTVDRKGNKLPHKDTPHLKPHHQSLPGKTYFEYPNSLSADSTPLPKSPGLKNRYGSSPAVSVRGYERKSKSSQPSSPNPYERVAKHITTNPNRRHSEFLSRPYSRHLYHNYNADANHDYLYDAKSPLKNRLKQTEIETDDDEDEEIEIDEDEQPNFPDTPSNELMRRQMYAYSMPLERPLEHPHFADDSGDATTYPDFDDARIAANLEEDEEIIITEDEYHKMAKRHYATSPQNAVEHDIDIGLDLDEEDAMEQNAALSLKAAKAANHALTPQNQSNTKIRPLPVPFSTAKSHGMIPAIPTAIDIDMKRTHTPQSSLVMSRSHNNVQRRGSKTKQVMFNMEALEALKLSIKPQQSQSDGNKSNISAVVPPIKKVVQQKSKSTTNTPSKHKTKKRSFIFSQNVVKEYTKPVNWRNSISIPPQKSLSNSASPQSVATSVTTSVTNKYNAPTSNLYNYTKKPGVVSKKRKRKSFTMNGTITY